MEEENFEVVNTLLDDHRIDPSKNEEFFSWFAVHFCVMERLLRNPRVNPSVFDNKAIREASKHGCTDVVCLLLQDKRVDPSAQDNYAIRTASAKGYLTIVHLLLNDTRVYRYVQDNEAIRMAKKTIIGQ